MPDRQRHSRLSEVLGRLFPARSQKPPATTGRRRSAAPAESWDAGSWEAEPWEAAPAAPWEAGQEWTPAAGPGAPLSPDARDEDRTPAAGPGKPLFRDAPDDDRIPAAGPGTPLWDDDPQAAVTMQLSRAAWEQATPSGREPRHLDPMSDTMQLSTSALFRPAGDPAGRDSGPETAADAEPTPMPAQVPARSRSRSFRPPALPPLLQERRRLVMGAAGFVAVLALIALPPVHAALRDSFTRLPQPYTALYFTSPPQVDGTVLTVPVSVRAVDTGRSAYSVHVWTVDAKGQVDDSKDADLSWDGQALSAVVSMPVNPAADVVWVSLGGSDETLHYKIAVA